MFYCLCFLFQKEIKFIIIKYLSIQIFVFEIYDCILCFMDFNSQVFMIGYWSMWFLLRMFEGFLLFFVFLLFIFIIVIFKDEEYIIFW